MIEHIESPGPKPGEPYWCDFCSSTPAFYRFGCRDHQQGTIAVGNALVTGMAYDDWLACKTCAILVLASKREELAEWSAKLYFERKKTPPFHRDAVRTAIYNAQDQFWSHRERERDRRLQPGEEIKPHADQG